MPWHESGTDLAHVASAIVCGAYLAREGVRRQASWLAGAGVALALLSLAAGFMWGRASAPICPAERVRENGGARWCLLTSPAREAGR